MSLIYFLFFYFVIKVALNDEFMYIIAFTLYRICEWLIVTIKNKLRLKIKLN
jgi:hypothetical protein